jgi:hypothetical protein
VTVGLEYEFGPCSKNSDPGPLGTTGVPVKNESRTYGSPKKGDVGGDPVAGGVRNTETKMNAD